MSEDGKGNRPGQATFAGWLIIVGSIVVVMSAWQRVSGLHTLEMQEALREALAEPPLSAMDLSLGQVQTVVRIASTMAAASGAAAAILGFHALRRSRSARLALTCLAPVLLICGFVAGGFFAPLVVAGIVILWLSPTRDWFAGRPWVNRMTPPSGRSKGDRTDRKVDRSGPSEVTGSDDRGPGGPAAFHGVSQAPPADQPFAAPGEQGGQVATVAPPYVGYSAPDQRLDPEVRRPGALTAACIITWVMTGATALMMAMVALAMAVARNEIFAELERQQPDFDFQGLSQRDLAIGVVMVAAVVIVWCLVAAVLAVIAFRGHNWARITVVVSAIAAGVASLIGMFANPLLVVVVISTAIAAGLLLRRNVSDWYRFRQ